MFSGSYDADDVTFLLKPVRLEPTEVAAKERLIQSGRRHYSEMISREALPSPAYLRVFHEALARNQARFAADLLVLAKHLASIRAGNVTLVSLARAGTPVGVLLGRILRTMLGRPVRHYSVSIIRDRGIDEVALRHILRYHAAESIVFVDGWTGKGVIAAELGRAVMSFNRQHGVELEPGLYAVADLCGAAAFAASSDDYLIPSSVLGATISGLVSRSILNDTVIGPGDFHGCLYYEEFAAEDLSRWFVDGMYAEIERQASGERRTSFERRLPAEQRVPFVQRALPGQVSFNTRVAPILSPLPCTRGRGVGGEGDSIPCETAESPRVIPPPLTPTPLPPSTGGEGTDIALAPKVASPNSLRARSETFLADMGRRFGIRSVNHIKPGLGEATRVLLRRVPQCVLVRDADAPEVAHLVLLAREKNVPIVVDASLPYTAAAIIKELDG